MAALGNLIVRLGLDTADFSKRLERTAKGLRAKFAGIGRGIASLAKPIGIVTAALGGLGAFSLGGILRETLPAVDALAKMADRIGTTTEALGGLRHAGGLAGVEVAALDTGLLKMARNVAEAATGNKALAETFMTLGLDARELMALRPEEQFLRIADAIATLPGQNAKIQATFDIFGKGGASIINLAQQGSEAIRAQIAEFESLGGAISRIDAAKIEIANDEFTRLGVVVTGIKQQISVALTPAIYGLTQALIGAAKEGEGLGTQIGKGIGTAISWLDRLRLGISGFVNFSRVQWNLFSAGVQLAMGKGIQAIEKLINTGIAGLHNLMGVVETLTGANLKGLAKQLRPLDFAIGDQLVADAERNVAEAQEAFYAAGENWAELGEDQTNLEKGIDDFVEAFETGAEKVAAASPVLFGTDDVDAWLESMEGAGEAAAETGRAGSAAGRAAAAGISEMEAAAEAAKKDLDSLEQSAKDFLKTGRQAFAEEVAGWRRLADEGRITEQQFRELSQKSAEEAMELNKQWKAVSSNMEEAFDNFVESGELSFRGMVDAILKDLARLAVSDLLKDIGGVILGTASGGGFSWANILGSFAGIFGGARADGGPVDSGRAYMVGEEGPELFVPRRAGTILPSGSWKDTAGGGGMQFQQTVNLAPGVSREELAVVLPALKKSTIDAVVEIIARGGKQARGFVY